MCSCLTSCCLAEFVCAISDISVTFLFIIEFFASAEIFLCWVRTNGGGTVSSLGFAFRNLSWINELVLGWMCFLPCSHAVCSCFTSYCLAEIVCAVSHVSITFNFIIEFFASAEIFLSWVLTNGVGTVSSLGFTLGNLSFIVELLLSWMCLLPRSHAVDIVLSHSSLT